MQTTSLLRRSGASLYVIAMFTTVGVVAPALAQEAPQARSEATTDTGEILVTARKREESLLKVPVAISALTSEDVAKRGIVSLNDLVNSTPGINVSNVSSGRNDRSFQQISLRGFTPSTQSTTLTASFIDGVPVSSASALNSISDPARVEILKGPQNAYFGRNAFAGAINVVNKLPGKELAGSFSGSVANRSGYDLQGSIEAPLVKDLLSFRLSAHAFSKKGSYINGADKSQTLGDQETRNISAMVVFTPASNLTIKGFGLLSSDKDGPSAQGMISAYELRANNGSINIPALSGSNAGTVIVANQSNCKLTGLNNGVSAAGGTSANPFICGAAPALSAFSPAQNTTSDAILASALSSPAFRAISPKDGTQGYGLKRHYVHLHLNVDYELGDTGLTLSSLTGYNYERYSELADLDNYDSTLLTKVFGAQMPFGNNPNLRNYWSFPFLVERANQDFSQELRVAYDQGGKLKAMIGGSYLLARTTSDLVNISSVEQNGVTQGAGSYSPPSKSKTLGIFGSLSYNFTDQFSLSVEGRYQSDQIYAFAGGRALAITTPIATQYGLTAGSFAPGSSFFNKKYNNFTPRIIVNYQATPDVMAYASFSQAVDVSSNSFNTNFLSGTATEVAAAQAIGLSVVTKPEKLNNYEVGLKGRFLDGRLRVSLAAYVAEWKDQYNNRTSIFLDPATNTAAIVSGVVNSGRSLLKGFEADITAVPVEGLSINASGSINESNIRSFTDPSITKLTGLLGSDFSGKQLPLTSKYSFNVGAQYTADLPGIDDATWFVRSDVSYKSKQYADASNVTWIKGRTVVNARLGVTKGQISIEAFANNLFNDRNYISIAENNLLEPSFALASKAYGYINVGLPELRTYGLKVGVKF